MTSSDHDTEPRRFPSGTGVGPDDAAETAGQVPAGGSPALSPPLSATTRVGAYTVSKCDGGPNGEQWLVTGPDTRGWFHTYGVAVSEAMTLDGYARRQTAHDSAHE